MSEESKAGEQSPAKMPWEEKPVPPQAKDAKDHPWVQELEQVLHGVVQQAQEFAGQVSLWVELANLFAALSTLKELGYKFLVDLTAVDWQNRPEGRFDVVYWLHRHRDSARLRVKAAVAEGQEVPSVVELWPTANWLEREVFDMFGLYFANHPSLERILTWEGFKGHPLRKDFPVEGLETGAAIYPDIYPPGGGPVKPKGGS
jgi:NADH-quinone oxidoreductase subunit C